MRNLKQAMAGTVAGGLLLFGGANAAGAQVDSVTRLDIADVAEELELSNDARDQLAPLLDRLNAALERRQEHVRRAGEIREELADTYDQISETLSAAELREFHLLIRQTAVGSRIGRPLGRCYEDGTHPPGYGGGPGFRGRRWGSGPGIHMRGPPGYAGQRTPGRGIRGGAGWGARPGWPSDGIDPKE